MAPSVLLPAASSYVKILRSMHQVLIDYRVHLKAYRQTNSRCFICRSRYCFAFQINQDYMCAECGKKSTSGLHMSFKESWWFHFRRFQVVKVPNWPAGCSLMMWKQHCFILSGSVGDARRHVAFWQTELFQCKVVLLHWTEQNTVLSQNNKLRGNRSPALHSVLMEQSGQMFQTSLWPIYMLLPEHLIWTLTGTE